MDIDRALDVENLRPVLNRVMQTHQLNKEDVKIEMSQIKVSDKGQFTCENCPMNGQNYPYVWHSNFSWITFNLIELEVVKRWRMKCRWCLRPWKPRFSIEQLEAMFERAVKFYKGEKFVPGVDIGYRGQRIFRQPHLPELCEKCIWGADTCWTRRMHF